MCEAYMWHYRTIDDSRDILRLWDAQPIWENAQFDIAGMGMTWQ